MGVWRSTTTTRSPGALPRRPGKPRPGIRKVAPGWVPGGMNQAGLGGQGGDFDFGAQGGLHERELRPVIEVLALAGEDGMGGDVDFQVKVPRWRTPGAGFPFSPEAQTGARIHPRRDAHLNLLLFFDHPGALTSGTGRANHSAGALAVRADVDHLQEPLGLAYLPGSLAAGTGLALTAGFRCRCRRNADRRHAVPPSGRCSGPGRPLPGTAPPAAADRRRVGADPPAPGSGRS